MISPKIILVSNLQNCESIYLTQLIWYTNSTFFNNVDFFHSEWLKLGFCWSSSSSMLEWSVKSFAPGSKPQKGREKNNNSYNSASIIPEGISKCYIFRIQGYAYGCLSCQNQKFLHFKVWKVNQLQKDMK